MAGYVYIISAGSRKHLYKVGIATDVRKRMRQLQTGCPHPIKLIGAIKCQEPRTLEKILHDALKRYRTQGEWFDCSLEDLRKAQHMLGLTSLFKKIDL